MTRFAFFGTPYVARDTLAALCRAGYVPSVVVTSPAAPKGRGLALQPCDTELYAREYGLPVLTPTALDVQFQTELDSYNCEYAVVVAYGKMLPQTLLDMFPLGVLNVHYSLLPLYRGASPVESALRNNDTVTGVSIQRMVLAMDAGDVLAQREELIHPNDTIRTLRPRLIELGSTVLIESLPSFIDGSTHYVPQDHSRATKAPKITKSEGELVLAPEHQLHNWLTYRALCESPGTYFYAVKDGGQRMRIKIASARYEHAEFVVERIIPEGKTEVPFSWLHDTGWVPERA